MALKFLNKKGWHTGSLRNIENVWKAEQKHGQEQKKLEELRRQILEEKERSEFRLLQQEAGLIPKQERLDFLYDSGISRRDTGTSGTAGTGVAFKSAEEAPPSKPTTAASGSDSNKQASAPGALFEEKPQSANDAWRKLHSDPLLVIRQREQEALASIKNNPVQMAMIRKSVETSKEKKTGDKKERRKKHRHGSSKHHRDSSEDSKSEVVVGRGGKSKIAEHVDTNYNGKRGSKSEDEPNLEGERRHYQSSKYKEQSFYGSTDRRDESTNYNGKRGSKLEDEPNLEGDRRHNQSSKYKEQSFYGSTDRRDESTNYNGKRGSKSEDEPRWEGERRHNQTSKYKERSPYGSADRREERRDRHDASNRNYDSNREHDTRKDVVDSVAAVPRGSHYNRRNGAPKLTDEERAAKLREMQIDGGLHEEQRWKRLKKAEEEDAQEASRGEISGSRNYLDAAHRTVYGAEKGGSSTIEESVRRRAHYSQGKSEVAKGNAFRR